MSEKICAECGGSYPPEFFRRCTRTSRSAPRCLGCEQTARDDLKHRNRWSVKAASTLRRHARKFVALGLAKDITEFKDRFGWDEKRIAHDMEFHYGNGCICGTKFAEMGNGLSDITLDIVRPNDRPYYTDNVRFICSTCNKGKGKAPPAVFSIRLLCWPKWRKRREQLKGDPWIGTLLEGSGYQGSVRSII